MGSADHQHWLIRAKLAVPPLPPSLVARERLVRSLEERLAHAQVVSVCASAGAGKTTAVAQAARTLELPLAWLTLDDADRAPGRLLTYLQAAVGERAPAADGVIDEALAAGVVHPDAAALLAQALGDSELVLVIDDADRLASSRAALDVLRGFVTYTPAGIRVVLISRREIAAELGARAALAAGATLGEAELAFTHEEAAEALEQTSGDPAAAVEATGGWVAGVLFEAWRSREHVPGTGGAADPLFGYLSTQILDELEPAQADFLVRTALLDVVTPDRAAALGIRAAGTTLCSLHVRRIPATWLDGGLAMRAHPRFREYLLHLLERRDRAELCELRRRHGELLMAEGHAEEAVEELLAAGARREAYAAARTAIGRVIERLDLAVAERWLAELEPSGDDVFTEAAATLAMGHEDYAETVRIADALPLDRLRQLVRRSPRAAAMFAWAHWHLGRLDDARTLLESCGDARETRLVVSLLELAAPGAGSPLPSRLASSGGPVEALFMRVAYTRGQLAGLVEEGSSTPWAAAMGDPGRIGALRALGRLEEAREAYAAERQPEARLPGASWLHGLLGVELMLDLGQGDAAWALLRRGRELIAETGSRVLEALSIVLEAKLALRLERDAATARRLLGGLDATVNPAAAYAFLRESIDGWLGWALLCEGEDAEALRLLRGAVASMERGDRILELPAAAVYLAEAEWRAGDEARADAAADIAFAAAERQGSRHILLQALADVPAVAARRLDAEPDPDSDWYAIARALVARTGGSRGRLSIDVVRVELSELGGGRVLVDGAVVQPHLRKAVELLAFLVAQPDGSASRTEIHDALFHGRHDRSSQAYLRQAVLRAREMLPEGIGPVADRTTVRLERPSALASVADRVEHLLDEAEELIGEPRLATLETAIAIGSAGPYLPEVAGDWADERRRRIADGLTGARLDAAALAFERGQHGTCRRLVEAALAEDPFREDGWRLAMSLADAVGDEQRLLDAYRRCREALGRIGVEPSHATEELFAHLRGAAPSTTVT